MSDGKPPFYEEFDCGLRVEGTPIGGDVKLSVHYADDTTPVHSATVGKKIFGSEQLRGTFTNKVTAGVKDIADVNADSAKTELLRWFSHINNLDKEERNKHFITEEARAIINGTRYPVEVYGGEETVWKVTLTYDGMTRELDFSPSEMVASGPNALIEKINNHFYDIVELYDDDWQAIRDEWVENKEVVGVVDETGKDAIADRVLEYLSTNLIPVADKEDMGNDVAAVWHDATNEMGHEKAGIDDPIAWVQDSFLVDQMEAAGKNTDYKPELIRHLSTRKDVYGGNVRKKWAWDTLTRVYPFDPESIGVSDDDTGTGDSPAHSEVGAL